jgi:hypothetical protein
LIIDLSIICSSKINIMLTLGSFIYSFSSWHRICGFYVTQFSSSTSVSKSFTWSPHALCSQYIDIFCSYF